MNIFFIDYSGSVLLSDMEECRCSTSRDGEMIIYPGYEPTIYVLNSAYVQCKGQGFVSSYLLFQGIMNITKEDIYISCSVFANKSNDKQMDCLSSYCQNMFYMFKDKIFESDIMSDFFSEAQGFASSFLDKK